jgi:hypothetical protein
MILLHGVSQSVSQLVTWLVCWMDGHLVSQSVGVPIRFIHTGSLLQSTIQLGEQCNNLICKTAQYAVTYSDKGWGFSRLS